MTSGRKTTRWKAGGEEAKFFINAMTINKNEFFLVRWVKTIHAAIWYVKLSEGDTSIYLQVNSLAKRILLPKSAIALAAKKGDLKKMIEERIKLFDDADIKKMSVEELQFNLPLISIDNETTAQQKKYVLALIPVFRCYQASAKSRKENGDQVKPLAETLAKVVIQALKQFKSAEELKQFEKLDSTYMEMDGQRFIIINKDDTLHVYHLQEFLGEGSFGTVYKVFDFATGKFKAFKRMVGLDDEMEAFAEAKKEVTAMAVANPKGESRVFQEPATHLVCILSPAGMVGIISELYKSRSLHRVLSSSTPQQKIKYFKQVMLALDEMTTKGIIHGDFKPLNILLGHDNIIRVADVATLRKAGKDVLSRPFPTHGECTFEYTTKEDVERLRKAADANDHNAFTEASLQQQIYSVGVTLYQILTGSFYPYRSKRMPPFSLPPPPSNDRKAQAEYREAQSKYEAESRYSDPTQPFNEQALVNVGCTPAVINLIKTMLHRDPAKRILDPAVLKHCAGLG